jgi:hypothetical protein
MGTRNLFKIIKDNKTVLAKYNQWDGDLSGQGTELSDFIINDLNFETLNNSISRIKMISDDTILDDIYENKDVKQYPLLTRDTTIRQQLQAISVGALSLETFDSSDFQKDGLFCEYLYELNLDNNTVNVFVTNTLKNGEYGACDKKLFSCDILEYPETLNKHIELNRGA